MQNALNTIKLQKISVHTAQNEKNYQPIPSSKGHEEQSLPPILCTNIYIFNPNKNVKRKVHCGKALFSKVYPFCAAVTCILPKSSSSSSVRFRLPVRKKKKEEDIRHSHSVNKCI